MRGGKRHDVPPTGGDLSAMTAHFSLRVICSLRACSIDNFCKLVGIDLPRAAQGNTRSCIAHMILEKKYLARNVVGNMKAGMFDEFILQLLSDD